LRTDNNIRITYHINILFFDFLLQSLLIILGRKPSFSSLTYLSIANICFSITMNSTFSSSEYAFSQFTATLFLSLIALATIIGNGLVIGAILTNKKLQNLSNYLLFSLSVTDLTVGTFIMPFRIYRDIYYPDKWKFGGIVCNVMVFIMVTTYLTSMLHIFAIAIDRYLIVTSIKYMQMRSKKHMYTIIGFTRVTDLFLALLPFMGLRSEDQFDHNIREERCKYDAGIIWYFPVIYLCCFVIPIIIMIPLYIGIYRVSIISPLN